MGTAAEVLRSRDPERVLRRQRARAPRRRRHGRGGAQPPGAIIPVSRALMVQGCTSSAGKSYLTAAICRILSNRGLKVAPFKAQNMSNNAGVTVDGLEMGRAQIVQAAAARDARRADEPRAAEAGERRAVTGDRSRRGRSRGVGDAVARAPAGGVVGGAGVDAVVVRRVRRGGDRGRGQPGRGEPRAPATSSTWPWRSRRATASATAR